MLTDLVTMTKYSIQGCSSPFNTHHNQSWKRRFTQVNSTYPTTHNLSKYSEAETPGRILPTKRTAYSLYILPMSQRIGKEKYMFESHYNSPGPILKHCLKHDQRAVSMSRLLQVRKQSTGNYILLIGQAMSSHCSARPHARTHTREVVISVPQTTLTGVFSLERDPQSLPFTKQRRGPFCPSRDPRPIISTDYRWPVWQPYWLRKRLFHLVPRSSLFSIETEIFSHFVPVVWKTSSRKKKECSQPHLFPFTCFPSLCLSIEI